MPSRYLLIKIFLLLSSNSFSQQGTLVIATITPSSIIIAVDSRGCYYETDDHTIPPIAYFDSARKSFKLKQFIVAIEGAFALGYNFYYKIIEDFNNTSFQDTSLLNTFNNFEEYLEKNYPLDSFPERRSNQFIGGGYVNGKAEIIGMSDKGVLAHHIGRGTIVGDAAAMKYAAINATKEGSIFDKLENTIYDYARAANLTFKIGGPISIIQIGTDNTAVSIKNDFSNSNYETLKDFYEAVKNDRILMNYTVPDGKERLLKVMRH